MSKTVTFATPPPAIETEVGPTVHSNELRDKQVLQSPYPSEVALSDIPPRSRSLSLSPPPQPPRPTANASTTHQGSEKALPPRQSKDDHEAISTTNTASSPLASPKPTLQERMYRWSTKAGAHVNRVTNKLGCEAWWPTSLDKECDKCARILKSFVREGVYTEDGPTSMFSPASAAAASHAREQPQKSYPIPSPGSMHHPGPAPKIDKATNRPITSSSIVKIPPSVIAQAKGLAIFTAFRTGGPQIGGAGGSGIVMVRLPDGSWSPPSGILPNNLSLGLMLGLDVYDCVCVLNTQQAVDAFTKRARFSLGGDIAMVAGPVGAGAQLDADVKFSGEASKPVWCYVKSRGFYAGVTVAGTVIIERPDANGMFYGEKKIRPERILRGEVVAQPHGTLAEDGSRMWPEGAQRLMDVVRGAEGNNDVKSKAGN